ncbi:ABC transporter permease subunit [Actinomyces viscosus]|uniref:Osmoprotectant uptake system permease protein yehY n=1 Tax=Actinomyces viscosus TaxID=1656 RepID=A0A3S4VCA8_ACTVI|nr:ABC transporter permease subunit [Actinomyces viscosus]TFH53597.1 ABC transporter permease subunit [Actinomyces viscosus]VEI14367.1 Putative osmoprotectant uptake system permease protein yehY [Actinomyces viscosus]
MSWVLANLTTIAGHLLAHLLQAVPAIIAAFVLAIPIARLARTSRPLRAVLVTGSSLLYAVPSLALFVILPIILATGIRDPLNVIVALTLYGLALLVPATADALDAVDARVLDAATAMGMGRIRCFLTVELPLAGPAILTGLRVVTVSTISLTTVGAVLGVRSLGWLFTDGFQRGITAEIVTGLVATAALALVLDGLVLVLGRLCLPWTWKRAGAVGQVRETAEAPAAGGHGDDGRQDQEDDA